MAIEYDQESLVKFAELLHGKDTEAIRSFIIQHPGIVNAKASTFFERPFLHYLASHGPIESFEILLQNGANPNIEYISQEGIKYRPIDVSMMMCGDSDRGIERISILLKYGADPNSSRCPLHWAIQQVARGETEAAIELMQKLILRKSDVNAKDKENYTPIDKVLGLCVKHESEKPIDVKYKHGHGSIAQTLKIRLLTILLEQRADPSITIGEITPLQWARINNLTELESLILEKGAKAQDLQKLIPEVEVTEIPEDMVDITRVGKFGETILHLAAEQGNIDTLAKLSQHARFQEVLNKQDMYGQTPLWVAAARNQPAAIDRLLGLGANAEIPALDSYSPAHVAACQGNIRILERLEAHNANLLIKKTPMGETPIKIAIRNHEKEAVKFLYDHAAEADNWIENMLYAHNNNATEMLDLLGTEEQVSMSINYLL